jgi:hypothetical protein
VAVDKAEGCSTIQLRVGVYRSSKCDVSGVMACSGARRSAGSAPSTPLLRVDNKSTIALIKNLVFHKQSKHIEVKYLLVRESVENDRIKVEFIRSEEQVGDILTKPLDKVKFLELHTKIGLIDDDGHNKT